MIIFEDDDLLVINKPAGFNTHAPSPFAGEGVYDWLRHREPRWATLAIIHRLDKETSGLLVFAKTPQANRSLSDQFTRRQVHKTYLLLTDRPLPSSEFTVVSALVRSGAKYVSRPLHAGATRAETRFRLLSSRQEQSLVEAEPLTGRTHQIRVHAAEQAFPVLGDTLYGGSPARRVYLHAKELTFKHPSTGAEMTFRAPADFGTGESSLSTSAETPRSEEEVENVDLGQSKRAAVIDPQLTNSYRLVHGASDGWPGWYVDCLGDYLLSQSERPLTQAQTDLLAAMLASRQDASQTFEPLNATRVRVSRPSGTSSSCQTQPNAEALGYSHDVPPGHGLVGFPTGSSSKSPLRGFYHKVLQRSSAGLAHTSPVHLLGEAAPERFLARENGLQFELSFREGYSVGLFLDQRDNRRRLLVNHVAAGFPVFAESAAGKEVLNTFAYTCAFSVCAAKARARTTSVDLSKKYLEWGKRNFAANGIDPAAHDFIYGDVFDWLRRMAKKQRLFDAILLDPPTFSRSKEHGVFQVERDYGKLVLAAIPLLRPGGVLFASTNNANWAPEEFITAVSAAVSSLQRKIIQRHYVPQPPDFPISRAEPAYLKTIWMRLH